MSVVLVRWRKVVDGVMDHIGRIDGVFKSRRDGTSIRLICKRLKQLTYNACNAIRYNKFSNYPEQATRNLLAFSCIFNLSVTWD